MEAHEILGISKDASEHEIRLAYKALVRQMPPFETSPYLLLYFVKAMKWHPDRQPLDTAAATTKFVEVRVLPFAAVLLTD